MNAEEARQVDTALRRLGVPGVVAPEDPDNPAGEWRVYDTADPTTRKDTTANALVAVVAKFRDANPEPTRRGPTRGFIIPPEED
ncbi:hypothetical protein [Streptomyces halobius]|uniref:PASTA domain-containing protein n=1 Tax=Streptomyces halobius TaxID=2879846 RepID=A0ABY4M990_9ACTN|nr:hypothetical protein [Streptomyces halobius]UQA94354.1 hypothetical protein K9S39_23065 [Streptomyces halobius]